MGTFKDTIMIKDRPYDRAVEVTVIYPDGMNVTNVQELAEKAWRSVNKTITIGQVHGESAEVQSVVISVQTRERYNV